MSDREETYSDLYNKGDQLFKDGKFEQSIENLARAYSINPVNEKLDKIKNIEKSWENETNKNKILISDKYYVDASYFGKLYNFQKEGVKWLFNVHQDQTGCILADDMGLGKTIQIIFYLRELLDSKKIKSALIIMPKSLLINWAREVEVWASGVTLLIYRGRDRNKNLKEIQENSGIMLTTYGTVMHHWKSLNHSPDFKWGVIVLDEGHRIKNPSSKNFKAINTLKANFRIVMTGTAVQNNLKELWALLEFTHQGSLLGKYPTFKREYETPITNSRKKDATQNEKLYGDHISMSLKNLIKPYFLRRTKEEVTSQLNKGEDSIPDLPSKNDIVVWVTMTEVQIGYYKKLLAHKKEKILKLQHEHRSPLIELNILKKICDHPRLMQAKDCKEFGLEVKPIDELDMDTLTSESGKMAILVKLVTKMYEEDHKCLIFFQSKVILTMIEHILKLLDITYLRLDGDTKKVEDRQCIVDTFNKVPEVKILLLTSQVGGVGLTITGADRVIIYDLNWNPSVHAQSVDRVYRIGQDKDVIVHRLVTCGTIEEKIYRRQIFKDSLNRQTTGIKKTDNNSYRYFTQNELFKLFKFDDPYKSDTQKQLHEMHSHEVRRNEYLDNYINWLCEQNIFGISHHNVLFSQEDETIKVDSETKEKLISDTKKAENKLKIEANKKSSPEQVKEKKILNSVIKKLFNKIHSHEMTGENKLRKEENQKSFLEGVDVNPILKTVTLRKRRTMHSHEMPDHKYRNKLRKLENKNYFHEGLHENPILDAVTQKQIHEMPAHKCRKVKIGCLGNCWNLH